MVRHVAFGMHEWLKNEGRMCSTAVLGKWPLPERDAMPTDWPPKKLWKVMSSMSVTSMGFWPTLSGRVWGDVGGNGSAEIDGSGMVPLEPEYSSQMRLMSFVHP